MAKISLPRIVYMNSLLAVNSGVIIGVTVAAVVLLVAVVVPMIMAKKINSIIFSRQDKNEKYKYFAPEDFGLTHSDVEVAYRRDSLYSQIYSVKPLCECSAVVIFQHGFGAGSSSYTTEIAALAKQGYAVVATDAYGCNNSNGKKSIGFYAGAEAVIATYIGVKRIQDLQDKKIILVGHSWGAYSVCCAAKRIKVDGVVALSGFNAPAQCVCDQLKAILSKQGRGVANLLHPYFYLLNTLIFGVSGNTKAAKALEKSGVKSLVIHGQKDRVVPLKHSVAANVGCENAKVEVLEDKKHNPYNTVNAEAKLSELAAYNGDDEEFYKNFDWSAATEEDDSVMQKIFAFIENVQNS